VLSGRHFNNARRNDSTQTTLKNQELDRKIC
jgi:hypothetical protein